MSYKNRYEPDAYSDATPSLKLNMTGPPNNDLQIGLDKTPFKTLVITFHGYGLPEESFIFSKDFETEFPDEVKILNGLLGMHSVKKKIQELFSRLKFQSTVGNPWTGFGHFIFTGNPGTGKTTIVKTLSTLFEKFLIRYGSNIPGAPAPAPPPPPPPPSGPTPAPKIEMTQTDLDDYIKKAVQDATGLDRWVQQVRDGHQTIGTLLSGAMGGQQLGQNATSLYQSTFPLYVTQGADNQRLLKQMQDDAMKLRSKAKPAPPPPPPLPPPTTPSNPFKYKRVTGEELRKMKPNEVDDLFNELKGNGLLFLDEAYQLAPTTDPGRGIMNRLMDLMEEHRKTFSLIIAGYDHEIKDLLKFNPGLPGRFTHTFNFENYSEKELKTLFLRYLKEQSETVKYRIALQSPTILEVWGKQARLAAKQANFSNARYVREQVVACIDRAQHRFMKAHPTDADKLVAHYRRRFQTLQHCAAIKDDSFVLQFSDVTPFMDLSRLKKRYEPIRRLHDFIGMRSAKRDILAIIQAAVRERIALLSDQAFPTPVYHTCVYGNPGTGKTSVGNILARVFFDLGMVTAPECVYVTPTELKGDVVGKAETLVREVIERARDSVLFIDEAYLLYDDTPYAKSMMDALVSQIQDKEGFRPIVILAGYEGPMEEMFLKANPGLRRRLQVRPPVRFEDLTSGDMNILIRQEVRRLAPTFRVTEAVTNYAVRLLELEKMSAHFGNAGSVQNLVKKAISSAQAGYRLDLAERDFGVLQQHADIFNPDKCPQMRPGSTMRQWYDRKRGQQQKCESRGKSFEMPLVFALAGRPGVGKTQSAKVLQAILNHMGLLKGTNFHTVSVSELTGRYAGQGGALTRDHLDKALGGVLFIDEAYRLRKEIAGPSVLSELVDSVTSEKYKQKVCVIFAGYEDELKATWQLNPGMERRVEMIKLADPTIDEQFRAFMEYMAQELMTEQLPKEEAERKEVEDAILEALRRLNEGIGENWGFFGDCQRFAQAIDERVPEALRWTADVVKEVCSEWLQSRGQDSRPKDLTPTTPFEWQDCECAPVFSQSTATAQTQKKPPQQSAVDTSSKPSMAAADAQNTDDFKLDEAKVEALVEAITTGAQQEIILQIQQDGGPNLPEFSLADLGDWVRKSVQKHKSYDFKDLQRKIKADIEAEKARVAEAKRKLEEAMAQKKKEEELLKLKQELEAAKQSALRAMGVCPQGFQWIQQSDGGYRCGGGSHYFSADQIDRMLRR